MITLLIATLILSFGLLIGKLIVELRNDDWMPDIPEDEV